MHSMSCKGNFWYNAVAESFFILSKLNLFFMNSAKQENKLKLVFLTILKCFITENVGIPLIIKCRPLTSNLFEMLLNFSVLFSVDGSLIDRILSIL